MPEVVEGRRRRRDHWLESFVGKNLRPHNIERCFRLSKVFANLSLFNDLWQNHTFPCALPGADPATPPESPAKSRRKTVAEGTG